MDALCYAKSCRAMGKFFVGLKMRGLLVLNRPALASDSKITSSVFAPHFAISGARTATPREL
jgi:hypothetical protein